MFGMFFTSYLLALYKWIFQTESEQVPYQEPILQEFQEFPPSMYGLVVGLD